MGRRGEWDSATHLLLRARRPVSQIFLAAGRGLGSPQIEYMVVSFDDPHHAAYLSLRQTEILMKLQSVTLDPELEKHKPEGWYVTSAGHAHRDHFRGLARADLIDVLGPL